MIGIFVLCHQFGIRFTFFLMAAFFDLCQLVTVKSLKDFDFCQKVFANHLGLLPNAVRGSQTKPGTSKKAMSSN
jgi:hypothetical protein